MRAAAILGLGCSPKQLSPFQKNKTIEWRIGMPEIGAADVVLIFGGDGTIHRHLGALLALRVPVLVIPVGSGNDFARSIGLRSVKQALAAWTAFCEGMNNVRTIDLGAVTPLVTDFSAPANAHHFSCVAGVGLDGEVSRRANALPRWLRGHGGYAISLIPALIHFAEFSMKLSVPNAAGSEWQKRSDGPTMLAAVANTPLFGDGMKIAPRAKMNDGLLDLCVLRGMDPFKLFCLFPTVYSGRHLRLTEVDYSTAEKVRIETEPPLDVYADGEYVCRTPVEISICKAALKIIAP